MSHENVLILDFGSQYTQLIARRTREARVYSEIIPFHTSWKDIQRRKPKGLILSGGPQSVFAPDSAHPDPKIFEFDGPLLGICYGMQLLAHHFGGNVVPSDRREYGKSLIEIKKTNSLFRNLPKETEVWMSHGDRVATVPKGFTVTAQSNHAIAAMENKDKNTHGLQFHPEVAHTSQGQKILENFLYQICGCRGEWTMTSFIEEQTKSIAKQIGPGRALCGLSGGIDSLVAALLVQKSIGERLTCIFVDNGLLRENEFQEVLSLFRRQFHLNVVGIDAQQQFLKKLEGVKDPEIKRKIIGKEFIRVFEDAAHKLGKTDFLVQGTLYPDVIESVSVKGPSAVIKSHHNVGGLPKKMKLSLVEPLRELFKDEVRQIATQLDLPEDITYRQPFPGPGLAVRILGSVTPGRLRILRQADKIVEQEIRAAHLYNNIWQSFAVLLPVKSVGVMGDGRTYENVIAIRAVQSLDGMTADWVQLPYEVLRLLSNRIVNEVQGINRVVYDISSKPPSTIEWE